MISLYRLDIGRLDTLLWERSTIEPPPAKGARDVARLGVQESVSLDPSGIVISCLVASHRNIFFF